MGWVRLDVVGGKGVKLVGFWVKQMWVWLIYVISGWVDVTGWKLTGLGKTGWEEGRFEDV